MITKSTKLDGNKVEVEVQITADEINQAVKNKYKEFATKYKFPGFRKGKVPRPVIDGQFGPGAVIAQVTDDMIQKCCLRSLSDTEISPVGQPDFGETELGIMKENEPYTFKYTVEVLPAAELESADPVEIKLPSPDATDDEIASQLDAFRNQFYTYEDAPKDAEAKEDSMLVLNSKATDDDGKEIDILTNESFRYHMGSGFLPEEFEEKLVGAKRGDELKFDVKIPETPTAFTTSIADETDNIHFDLKVEDIQYKTLPELDDKFAEENMGFKTLDEVKKQIATQIEAEKSKYYPIWKENLAIDQLTKRVKVEVPEAMKEQEEAELLQNFFTQLQQQGATFDDYLKQNDLTSEKFKEDVKKQAEEVCKQNLALDAYAAMKNIKATEEDIIQEFKAGDPDNWKKLFNDWRDRGELNKVRAAIIRMKAAKDLVDNAKVGKLEVPKPEDKKPEKKAPKKPKADKKEEK